jgi:putative transposase
MRIKAEQFTQDSYYHIYNHASYNMNLFNDDMDYQRYFELIKRYLDNKNFDISSFCLMPNHFHFLLKQNIAIPVYEPFIQICYQYSRYYNNKYDHKGTIFASKLQHIHVDKDNYILWLCAYIHLNPIKAGLCKSIEDWNWSNFLEWVQQRNLFTYDSSIRDANFTSPKSYIKYLSEINLDRLESKYSIDS